ncbi:MAG: enoyl-CoA hydratase/isomerase family protein [Acidimicrobiales bacterium]|nr:enoyl-CoA hydratase/isomerase family protein [Acidimicrobiales bacterium]
MSRTLREERPADGVVLLTLDRPDRRNALSIELRDALSDALDRLSDDESVRCVVLTGAGTTFSAGFDLGEFTAAADDPALGERLWASSDRYHATVLRCPLPLVAAVNGPAIAGGFDLAVLCDVRIGAHTARFAHPERTFGPVVYAPLRELVGGATARDLCLTGREIDAEEAHRVGLLQAVVPADRVVAEALAVAERTAEAPRALLADTKAKILRVAGISPGATLDL